MAGYSAASPRAGTEAFRLWAEVYDEQPNPLLTLEDRILAALLPEISGRDVIDLGCGTGRWLARLAQKSPASLYGIDISAEMLERAARKLGKHAKLSQGDCATAPLAAESADIVLASFVLAHLSDPGQFAAQIGRVLRKSGSAFISDLHPGTVQALGWSRSFRSHSGLVELGTENWSLPFLISVFEGASLEVAAQVEARFGGPEIDLLGRSGRSSAMEAARTRPAIYVLQLRKKPASNPAGSSVRISSITGAHVALTPTDTIAANIRLEHTKLQAISPTVRPGINDVDLTGYTLLPGLINSHDHLEFALFPRLGHGRYNNFTEWYRDIQYTDRDTIDRHQSIPKATRVWWGAVRNLLSGVTTVCHHNPIHADMMSEDFPVRVVQQLGWAHSVSLTPDFARRHRKTDGNRRFVIHLGEGIDASSRREFHELVEAGALDDRTVIVHGVACDSDTAREINRSKAALIWCPSSNVFLFGQTHARSSLQWFNNVTIGSDSPLTGTGDLLDEIRFAAALEAADDIDLYRWTTTEAARVLQLNGAGTIRVGATADLIAVRGAVATPCSAVSSLSYRDIHLVLRGGRVQLASPELMERIPRPLRVGLRPLEVDGLVRWIRAPLSRMFRDVAPVLGGDIFLNGRRVRNVVADWI